MGARRGLLLCCFVVLLGATDPFSPAIAAVDEGGLADAGAPPDRVRDGGASGEHPADAAVVPDAAADAGRASGGTADAATAGDASTSASSAPPRVEEGGLVLISRIEGARLFVDGLPAAVGQPIRLLPGEHYVEARRDGYLAHRIEVRVEAGKVERLEIDPTPIVPVVAPPAPPSRWWIAVEAGCAAVLGATGVTIGVLVARAGAPPLFYEGNVPPGFARVSP